MLETITPLLLTFNEAPNIGRTLDRLTWARDILIVDSFSNDETLAIASRYPQVRILQREFSSFADQCNYGLNCGDIKTDWVLSLDADYVLTDEVVKEIGSLMPESETAGYRARFIYCVDGKQLRSGIYPPVTVLFRRKHAKFISDGHAHRLKVEGTVTDLQSRILHDDRKPFKRWLESQKKYAALEARKLRETPSEVLAWTDRLRKWRVIAPPAMLIYCLILRAGILDGWAGFHYAYQRTLAELILSLQLMKSKEAQVASRVTSVVLDEPTANLKVQRTKP